MNDITKFLNAINLEETQTPEFPNLVYDELHRIAMILVHKEKPGGTIQPTGLVHEAFLRLFGAKTPIWKDRRHFFGFAAKVMKHILVDQALHRQRLKRGGDFVRVDALDFEMPARDQALDFELLAVAEALDDFEKVHPEKAQLVRLRYYVGLTLQEAADVLGISRATAANWWAFSKAWLFRRIHGNDGS
jgi:RNA polymerase sigma factor (TIGR02999 family)